jgi:endonuclease/exonuclease/phosphatase family metal-dependent hydrolase
MKNFILLLALSLFPNVSEAVSVFNLNVFDQLQGEWPEDFRENRMQLATNEIKKLHPDLVVFQEAKGVLSGEKLGGKDSVDGANLKKLYPHRMYIHEMIGKDQASYGYWMGSKMKPKRWIEDGFFFEGGVDRKIQAAVFSKIHGGKCLGVMSLHLSYQNSEVRVKEAEWILQWLKEKEKICKHWLVVGDFNADAESAEMKRLFEGGLKVLPDQSAPTVGAFNPIRRIYGENIPSKTIDWALGWNIDGRAELKLDHEIEGQWASDHAAIFVKVK